MKYKFCVSCGCHYHWCYHVPANPAHAIAAAASGPQVDVFVEVCIYTCCYNIITRLLVISILTTGYGHSDSMLGHVDCAIYVLTWKLVSCL